MNKQDRQDLHDFFMNQTRIAPTKNEIEAYRQIRGLIPDISEEGVKEFRTTRDYLLIRAADKVLKSKRAIGQGFTGIGSLELTYTTFKKGNKINACIRYRIVTPLTWMTHP